MLAARRAPQGPCQALSEAGHCLPRAVWSGVPAAAVAPCISGDDSGFQPEILRSQ